MRTSHGTIFLCFFNSKTNGAQYVVLHRCVDCGGWSVPIIINCARSLALRTSFRCLKNPTYLAVIIALERLRPLGRHLLGYRNFKMVMKRETPGRQYAAVVAHSGGVGGVLKVDDFLILPAARVSKLQAALGTTLSSRTPKKMAELSGIPANLDPRVPSGDGT